MSNNTINRGLQSVKKLIESGDLAGAELTISKVATLAERSHYQEYNVYFLQTGIALKQNKFKDAMNYGLKAIHAKPEEPAAYKVYIQSCKNNNCEKEILNIIPQILKEAKPVDYIAKLIGPYLNEMEKEEVLDFLNYFKKIENYQSITEIGKMLPDIDETVEMRVELLSRIAKTDEEACESLIEILLYDKKDFQNAIKYSKFLPENNQSRLLVDALFGDDPIGAARKHISNGSQKFKQFVEAVDKNDLKRINMQLSYINYFYSGWIYYANLCTSNNMKLSALQEAEKIMPNSESVLDQLANLYENMNKIDNEIYVLKKLIVFDKKYQSKLVELCLKYKKTEILKDIELQPQEKILVNMYRYKETHNKDLIRDVIDLPNEKQIVSIKMDVLWEFKEELKDTIEARIIECLKIDKENGNGYYYLGKLKEEKGESDKANFLYKKAFEYGSKKPEIFEMLSRECIKENDIEKALEYCKMIDETWAHFRAGLIYQRLGHHETACKELQQVTNKEPMNANAWKALGHSNILLNRWMVALSISEELQKIGKPDFDLECQLDNFFSKPIDINVLEIEKTPIRYISYLQQMTKMIHDFRTYGRNEAALTLINNVMKTLSIFINKWDSLQSALQVIAKFYFEAYKVNNLQEYIQKSIQFYIKRASKDVRAESFIDLAQAMFANSQIDYSLSTLSRAIRKFPEHPGLWINLGLLFAIKGNYLFATHCFCAGLKLGSNNEKGTIYSYFIPIAEKNDDQFLKEKAIKAALEFNPQDPIVIQLLGDNGLRKILDSYLLSFENAPSQYVLAKLPYLLIKNNRPLEALGFAFILNDKEVISLAYKALNQINIAKEYDNSIDVKESEIWKLYQTKNLEEIIEKFKDSSDVYEKLAVAICLIQTKKFNESLEILNTIKENEKYLTKTIDLIILKNFPKDFEFKSSLSQKDSEVLYYEMLRQYSNPLRAIQETTEIFRDDEFALKNFVIEGLKSQSDKSLNLLIINSENLYKLYPSQSTLSLLFAVQVRTQNYNEAIKSAQKLCLMKPKDAPKLISLIQKLQNNINN